MMGVGKSTIGKSLSRRLNVRFEDIDAIIEKKNSLSIKEIFDKKGEEFFRKIEEEETLGCIKEQNLIIALGGGAFINKILRDKILKRSISIWLDISLETINKRIRWSKKRPLLTGSDKEKKVKKLYNERRNIYEQAKYKINCNNLSKINISKKIISLYEK